MSLLPTVALSIKQPWAALIICGVKTIEIRTWPTQRRGPILVHAGKVPDPRTHGWEQLTTPELRALAELRGGIVGVADLSACQTYPTSEAFAVDTPHHRNAPEWFAPPRLFGFVFASARQLPFFPYAGRTLFFEVEPLSAAD